MKESRQIEFKSDISNSFLKTVSAFANYDGGQIIFGVFDAVSPSQRLKRISLIFAA